MERGGKDESEPPAYLKPEALVDRLGARRLLPRAVQAQRQARRASPGPLQPRADPVGPVLAGREGRTGIGGQEPGAEGREAIAHLRSQPAGRGLARGPGRQALRGLPRPQAVHAARGRGAGVWCVMMIAGKVARGGALPSHDQGVGGVACRILASISTLSFQKATPVSTTRKLMAAKWERCRTRGRIGVPLIVP